MEDEYSKEEIMMIEIINEYCEKKKVKASPISRIKELYIEKTDDKKLEKLEGGLTRFFKKRKKIFKFHRVKPGSHKVSILQEIIQDLKYQNLDNLDYEDSFPILYDCFNYILSYISNGNVITKLLIVSKSFYNYFNNNPISKIKILEHIKFSIFSNPIIKQNFVFKILIDNTSKKKDKTYNNNPANNPQKENKKKEVKEKKEEEEEDEKSNFSFSNSIFKCFPNLNELTIKFSNININAYRHLYISRGEILKKDKWGKIDDRLFEYTPNLKKLEFQKMPSRFKGLGFKYLIKLNEIIIKDSTIDFNIFSKIIQVEKVKLINVENDNNISCKSINGLAFLSNLKELYIEKGNAIPFVNELEVEKNKAYNYTTPKNVFRFDKYYPNLESLILKDATSFGDEFKIFNFSNNLKLKWIYYKSIHSRQREAFRKQLKISKYKGKYQIEPKEKIINRILKKGEEKAVVLYDYTPGEKDKNELAIVKGEEVIIIHSIDNWDKVINSKGEIGFVPGPYLRRI